MSLVINRGIAGQDAAEEVPRIDSDVIAIRPTMVIWQVGANGVLRSVDPAVYKNLLATGIGHLEKAGIDVVLMDNQRSPAVEGAPEHLLINAATADAAASTDVALFSRSELMDQWRHAGMSYDQFISSDGMHHNDRGYRCLADALARAIAAGLGPDRAVVAKPAPVSSSVPRRNRLWNCGFLRQDAGGFLASAERARAHGDSARKGAPGP